MIKILPHYLSRILIRTDCPAKAGSMIIKGKVRYRGIENIINKLFLSGKSHIPSVSHSSPKSSMPTSKLLNF